MTACPLGLATCPVLPPALDRPFIQGFPRNESETQRKENDSRKSSAPTPDLVCRFTKNAFFKALFCRQKRITEKGIPTPKLNSLTKASKVFMRHLKDCNYECYDWLTASTEHKLFCWPCLLLIRAKGHGMTDPWTLFTSDRWVLYYLMSIVSCTLLWRCTWCVDNTVWVCGCPAFVQFCCFGRIVILI